MSCQHFFRTCNVLFRAAVLRRLLGLILAMKGIEYYHQHSIPSNRFTLDLNNVSCCVTWPCSISLLCELENMISLKLKISGWRNLLTRQLFCWVCSFYLFSTRGISLCLNQGATTNSAGIQKQFVIIWDTKSLIKE